MSSSSTAGADPHSFSAGVIAGDLVAQGFHEAVSAGARLFRDSEAAFLRDDLVLRERLSLIDRLVTNLSEERRILEVQLQDSRNQATHAKKKSAIISAETQRMTSAFANPQQLLQLDKEEQRIEEQHRALQAKLQEMVSVSNALDARLKDAQQMESRVEQDELKLFNKERDYENAKREMAALEQEVEARRRSLERKEESISSWMRALDTREAELTRCQQQFREDLERIEVEEQRLADAMAAAVTNPAWAAATQSAATTNGTAATAATAGAAATGTGGQFTSGTVAGGFSAHPLGSRNLQHRTSPSAAVPPHPRHQAFAPVGSGIAALSQRAVMDDHGMTIERDDDTDDDLDSNDDDAVDESSA